MSYLRVAGFRCYCDICEWETVFGFAFTVIVGFGEIVVDSIDEGDDDAGGEDEACCWTEIGEGDFGGVETVEV